MEVFWHIIGGIIFGVFFVLAGYDYGTGIIHLLFAKTKKDKEVIANSAGSLWGFKAIWMLAGAGLIYLAFPLLFSSSFQGFYIPLLVIVILVMSRAIGLKLRTKFNSEKQKEIWYKAFGISSLLLAFFFGVSLGNIIRGVNLGGIENGIFTLDKNYFHLPFMDASFSPMTIHPGLLDWFTILIGAISVIALSIHGSNWIILKTNSSINNYLKIVILRLNILLFLFTVFAVISWLIINPDALNNFIDKPFFGVFPMLYFVAIFGMFYIKKFNKDIYGFLFSTLIVLAGITTTLASIFPVVLPSTNSLNNPLTIYNTVAKDNGLPTFLGWGIVIIVLVLIYIIVKKRILNGKIDG